MTCSRRTTVSALGLTLLAAFWTASAAAQVVADVDISNRSNGQIRVKRIGINDGDVATADVAANDNTTFPGVPFNGDQAFVAWTADGRFIGSTQIKVATAQQVNPTLLVTPNGIFVEARQKGSGPGPARPNNPGPGPGPGNFSRKLGINYARVPLANGTFGARLTRNAPPNSPAGQLGLEEGDMIVSMDDLPFTTPADVDNHYGDTSMIFINVRTGQPQAARLNLP
jgi:hypothetical protein